MSESARILVVDDETELSEAVADYLAAYGYAVTTACDGRSLDAAMAGQVFDLILLDLRMPGEDGLSIARRLRLAGAVPIIMVTAMGETVDRVVGLEVGADDYIVKPFDMRELLARIRSVLRRAATAPAAGPEPDRLAAAAGMTPFGRCRLDLKGHRLFGPDGLEIRITAMEFALLRAFAQRPNRVLTRDQLLDLAHDRDWEPFDRSIDIRIARLRRKIEQDPANPQIIRTVRGSGYMFVPAGSPP